MNSKTGKLMTLVAVVLTICLFPLEQSALAQSPNSNCKQAKGKFIDVLTSVGTTGTITNGGILNGTTETVYNPASIFTLTLTLSPTLPT